MIDRTALCIENGLFQPLAHRLARDYRRVLYWRPWVGSFAHPNDYYLGSGYDDIERIEAYEPHFNDPDVTWVIPDVYYAPLQKWLRESGHQVWGAGHGEELELMRGETKELMEDIRLPVKPWARIIGMEALREHLQENENVFVKVSKVRGLTETFGSTNYDLVKPKLDTIESELGGRAEVQEFIVEEGVDTQCEVGYDGYCIDGAFPKTALVGVEKKDCCYFGEIKPYDSLSRQVREVNDKLSTAMREYRYRGFFSTEIRVGKDNKPYLIDCTCRHASPAGEAILETCSNIAEVIEAGSQGQLVDMKPIARYVAQALLLSEFAEEHWLPIAIPEKIRSHVHLYHSCMVDGQEFVVPETLDMPQIGSVTACSDSPEKAIKLCSEYCSQIKSFGLKDNCDFLSDAYAELRRA